MQSCLYARPELMAASRRSPQYCSASSGIPEYSGANITAILAKYSPNTLDYMNKYWLDYQVRS